MTTDDVTRLQAALEQNGRDAIAIEALVGEAAGVLPDHLVESLRARAADIARMVRRTGADADEQKREIAARANREDIMRRALTERIAQLDAARIVAATLAGKALEPQWKAPDDEARALAGAEAFARTLGLSSAEGAALRAVPVEAQRARALGQPSPEAAKKMTRPAKPARAKAKKAAPKAKVKRAAKKGGKR